MANGRLGKIILTRERPQGTACFACQKRTTGCHGKCVDYAVESIIGALTMAETRQRQRSEYDLAQFEPERSIRKGTRYR